MGFLINFEGILEILKSYLKTFTLFACRLNFYLLPL